MGFFDKIKEGVKDVFGGKEETTKKEKIEPEQQESKKAVDVGEETDSGDFQRTGGYTKTGGEPTGGGGTSGGGGGGTGGGGRITSTSGSVKTKEQAREIEKGLQKTEARKEQQKRKDKREQRTTQTQAQQLRQKFQEQDVLGSRVSRQEGFGPRTTTQETPSEFRISQQQQSRINRYFGGENQKSKPGKPTQISKAKDTGYSSYTSPYDQSVGAGIVQSFENIAGIPKDFFEGKRGEDLYGGIFQPLSLSAKTGAE